MIHNTVTRHPIKTKGLKQAYECDLEIIEIAKESIQTRAGNVPLLAKSARNCALLGIALECEITTIASHLNLFAEAFASVFQCHFCAEDALKISLNGETFNIQNPSSIDESYIYVGNWIDCLFGSMICRNATVSGYLCTIEFSKLRLSSTRCDEAYYTTAEILRALIQQHDDIHKLFKTARGNFEESESLGVAYELMSARIAPLLPLVQSLADSSNHCNFPDALFRALESHRNYYSKDTARRNEWYGFASLPLLAMCALAYDSDVHHNIESDYIPKSLYTG